MSGKQNFKKRNFFDDLDRLEKFQLCEDREIKKVDTLSANLKRYIACNNFVDALIATDRICDILLKLIGEYDDTYLNIIYTCLDSEKVSDFELIQSFRDDYLKLKSRYSSYKIISAKILAKLNKMT